LKKKFGIFENLCGKVEVFGNFREKSIFWDFEGEKFEIFGFWGKICVF
jgi:hypothetical protein